ncbi:hypothetical protein [Miniphocaeibacter massiliensis]|uniref:hypothetical protein n=1 Tax=Miniphocaeibacter massiliensis TaxID=2041841 RepID=UPI000C1BD4C5|nr:hypothetical protein [Miniphocaeibacter massiliensis]
MKIIEKHELKDFEQILQFNGSSIGGNEKWFNEYNKSHYLAEKGSGLIAAANMLIYISKVNKEYNMLFDKELNYENYMEFATYLQKCIRVTPLGIFTVYQMNRGIRKFTNIKGKKMHLMKNYWKWNSESAFEYIKSGLFSNNPVLMMTWNSKIEELKNRWVCITEIRRYDNGKLEVTVLNYGEKRIYDLNEWINSKSLYKGLIYYK